MPMTNFKGPYRNLDTIGAFMAFLGAQQITIRESLGSTPVFRGVRYSGAACQPRLQFPRADTVQAMCLNSRLTPPETKKYTEINTHEDRFYYRGHRLGGGDRPKGSNMNSGVGRTHR